MCASTIANRKKIVIVTSPWRKSACMIFNNQRREDKTSFYANAFFRQIIFFFRKYQLEIGDAHSMPNCGFATCYNYARGTWCPLPIKSTCTYVSCVKASFFPSRRCRNEMICWKSHKIHHSAETKRIRMQALTRSIIFIKKSSFQRNPA